MRGRLAVSLSVALTLALAGSAAPAAVAKTTRPRAAHAALPAFPSCPALLRYARAGAHRTDGQTGVPPRAVPGTATVLATPAPTPAKTGTPTAAAPTAEADAGTSTPFSSTNNQETDVDEPDLVKTDGRQIYTVVDRVLRVVDVTGPQPRLVGQLALEGYGHRLLLRGDTLLVIADRNGFVYFEGGGPGIAVSTIAPVPGRGRTIVTEVSVADPAAPVVRRTLTVDGDFVDARQNGGTARLVIDSAPDAIEPQGGETVDKAIDDTHSTDFIGGTVLRSRVSGRTYRRRLVHCDQVRHPRAFSGLDVLTIMTVDLDKGLYSLDRDGVMAGAQVVYGSDRSLYVASQRYSAQPDSTGDVPEGVRTEIHRFDISDPQRTTYRATGSVPGYVLNQYALSEYGGDLRVATTEEPLWLAGSMATDSQSGVSVLRERDGILQPVGRLGGLGRSERIYAVRFIADRGYLVTFRQVDPLFVVDLSDPAAPRLRGELELPGYSAYLHPVGTDRLLGIGQSSATRTAAQASLFDVSDPAAPKRLSQVAFGAGSFDVEHDPHAFLYWGPTKLAVLPLTTYGDSGQTGFTGAVGLRVGDTLAEAGRIGHPPTADGGLPAVSRAVVIGDRLFTLSYAGLGESRLGDLGMIGFTSFPGTPS